MNILTKAGLIARGIARSRPALITDRHGDRQRAPSLKHAEAASLPDLPVQPPRLEFCRFAGSEGRAILAPAKRLRRDFLPSNVPVTGDGVGGLRRRVRR
jgi:hypothetical protein